MEEYRMTKKCTVLLCVLACLGIALTTWSCTGLTQPESAKRTDILDRQETMVAELNAAHFPLTFSIPDLRDYDLAPLDVFKDTRIVALGEATHGTREFFQMKHRVFKYLVEHHGFKAFGFEADFAESLYFDRYITTGEGDLDQLMRTKMHFWTWNTEEVRELLEWMREYNEDKAPQDMIRYYGFDCQYLTFQATWIREYLETVSPGFLAEAEPVLALTKTLNYANYTDLTPEENLQYQEDFQRFFDRMAEKEAEFVPLSSQREYDIVLQLARTMVQTHEARWKTRLTGGGAMTNYRDRYMAENAVWIANFMGDGAKIALWAHNGHVGNDMYYYRDDRSMGGYLRDQLGEAYKVIGFSFSTGSFTAVRRRFATGLGTCVIDKEPNADSINYIFHKAAYKNFILVLDHLPSGGGLREWLSSYRPFITIGSVYYGFPYYVYAPTRLMTYLDAVIHFDETTHSVPMQY